MEVESHREGEGGVRRERDGLGGGQEVRVVLSRGVRGLA